MKKSAPRMARLTARQADQVCTGRIETLITARAQITAADDTAHGVIEIAAALAKIRGRGRPSDPDTASRYQLIAALVVMARAMHPRWSLTQCFKEVAKDTGTSLATVRKRAWKKWGAAVTVDCSPQAYQDGAALVRKRYVEIRRSRGITDPTKLIY